VLTVIPIKHFIDLDSQIDSMTFKQSDGAWCCLECGYSSKIKTNLRMHVESKHIVSNGFNCPECQLFCPNRQSLKNHIDRKHKERKLKKQFY